MAVTDPGSRTHGISAFAVEKSDEGVSFGALKKKLGIKGSPTKEVDLDNVRIPASRMIGAEGTGFETAMRTRDHTRVTSAAQAVGVAHGALDYALEYAAERKQFGKSIWEFQGMHHPLDWVVAGVAAEHLNGIGGGLHRDVRGEALGGRAEEGQVVCGARARRTSATCAPSVSRLRECSRTDPLAAASRPRWRAHRMAYHLVLLS